jgi:hypothetical protein
LKIHSPNVFNWTIIDLPGMMKQPIGSLPENIELIDTRLHQKSSLVSGGRANLHSADREQRQFEVGQGN